MKHIKLFESFSGLKPEEILKDIKTISYILEDGGYDIRYFYNISQPFSGVRSINSDELEGMIDAGHYKRSKIKWNSIIIIIIPFYENELDEPDKSKMKFDGDYFLNLLKEHLDYIDDSRIINYINTSDSYQIKIDL
jgi:hypothetical protein